MSEVTNHRMKRSLILAGGGMKVACEEMMGYMTFGEERL
jgi:hypothetical protein